MPDHLDRPNESQFLRGLSRRVYREESRTGPPYLTRDGGRLTGRLHGPAGLDPIRPDELARKAYVDGRVLRTGDTMTGALTMAGDNYIYASRGLRVGEVYGEAGLYRPAVDGAIKIASEGVDFVNVLNGFLASLDIGGNFKATGFNVGDTGEQRMEMHRHSGAWGVGTFLHFYAPGEMEHGNLYQDTIGAVGARRQRLWLYPSDMGWGTPQIRMVSSSEDGAIKSEAFIDGATWIKDSAADRSFLVGVGGNCRAVNAANTTWTPLEASEFIPVPSDPAVKESIRPAPTNMTADLRAVKVIRYRLREGWDDGSRVEHLSVDATSLPAIVQRRASMRDTTITGYELGAMVAWLYGVTQEIDARLTAVESGR